MTPPPRYPNVRCNTPGHPDAPGFVICYHVIAESRAVWYREDPQPDKLGVLICAECAQTENTGRPIDARIVCAECARPFMAPGVIQ